MTHSLLAHQGLCGRLLFLYGHAAKLHPPWQAVVPTKVLTFVAYVLAHSTIMSCFSSKCAHGGHGSTVEDLSLPQASALLSRPEPESTVVLHFSRQMKPHCLSSIGKPTPTETKVVCRAAFPHRQCYSAKPLGLFSYPRYCHCYPPHPTIQMPFEAWAELLAETTYADDWGLATSVSTVSEMHDGLQLFWWTSTLLKCTESEIQLVRCFALCLDKDSR